MAPRAAPGVLYKIEVDWSHSHRLLERLPGRTTMPKRAMLRSDATVSIGIALGGGPYAAQRQMERVAGG